MNDFLKWDMIGPVVPSTAPPEYYGGFSLRTRAKMLQVLQTLPVLAGPEEAYFLRGLRALNAQLPPPATAHEFAFRAEVALAQPLAVYRPYHVQPQSVKARVEGWCPEYKMVGIYDPKPMARAFRTEPHPHLKPGEWDAHPKAPQGGRVCAHEGQPCACDGTVRYGQGEYLFSREVTGSIACTNGAFGGDPILNVPKLCMCESKGSAPKPSVPWEPRVLVTGAQSRLGTLVVRGFEAQGLSVVAVDSWSQYRSVWYGEEASAKVRVVCVPPLRPTSLPGKPYVRPPTPLRTPPDDPVRDARRMCNGPLLWLTHPTNTSAHGSAPEPQKGDQAPCCLAQREPSTVHKGFSPQTGTSAYTNQAIMVKENGPPP